MIYDGLDGLISWDRVDEVGEVGGVDGVDEVGSMDEYNELFLVSSYYNALTAKIFNFMKCLEERGQLILKCENLIRLMASLLVDYEEKIKALPDGYLRYYNLFEKAYLPYLEKEFYHLKMVKEYPDLYKETAYGKQVLINLDGKDENLHKLLRIGKSNQLTNQMKLIQLSNKGSDLNDFLSEIVKGKKEEIEKNRDIEIFTINPVKNPVNASFTSKKKSGKKKKQTMKKKKSGKKQTMKKKKQKRRKKNQGK